MSLQQTHWRPRSRIAKKARCPDTKRDTTKKGLLWGHIISKKTNKHKTAIRTTKEKLKRLNPFDRAPTPTWWPTVGLWEQMYYWYTRYDLQNLMLPGLKPYNLHKLGHVSCVGSVRTDLITATWGSRSSTDIDREQIRSRSLFWRAKCYNGVFSVQERVYLVYSGVPGYHPSRLGRLVSTAAVDCLVDHRHLSDVWNSTKVCLP